MRPAHRTVVHPSVWLPPRLQSVDNAVAAGLLDADAAENVGYRAVAVASSHSPGEMAVLAAESALDRAGCPPAEVELLLHACSYYQGHDFFSPAHYIAREVGAMGAVPIGIAQMCNGAGAALELAVGQMSAAGGPTAVLLTTADAFIEPGFHRWTSDYGMVYGDGATAAVLRIDPPSRGGLRLGAIVSHAEAELEAAHRGDRSFAPAARWRAAAVDVRETKKEFLRCGHDVNVAERSALHSILGRACAEAGISPGELTVVVPPRLSAAVIDTNYRPVLSALTAAEILVGGRDTGHLGAGDLLAGLAMLCERGGEDSPMAVLSAGAGFTWSCAVVLPDE